MPLPLGARSIPICIATLVLHSGSVAQAQVPTEFIGKWTSEPPRCEPVTGEVDVLEVVENGLSFYEIDCTLSRPTRKGSAVRFSARCSKGGIPESAGAVTLQPIKPSKVSVAFSHFRWVTTEPFVFTRCRR